MAGRKRKYGTAKALERAVDGYFAAISYASPAVASVPTGEVDELGKPQWTTLMLRQPASGPGMKGKPIVETKWIRPPSMAGLMLHLGISRETWRSYSELDGYREVIERARARMEDFWITRLNGKGAQGAKFALSCCYGWREGAPEEDQRGKLGDDPITAALKESVNAVEKAT